MPADVLSALYEEAKAAYHEGDFVAASVGKGLEKQRISELRGDRIRWLHRDSASEPLRLYWSFLDALMQHLSGFFRVHLERIELHYAVYPPGSFYTRHLDQFREHSNRIFTVILYLNPNWKPGHGGELVAYLPHSTLSISPVMGNMVVFRSDLIEHEVLPARDHRLSLTGWMRRDSFVF